VEDWNKVKRIFKYLNGTMNYGILFRSSGPRRIEAFSDADYARDVDTRHRSMSSAICRYAGGAITWLSQKQKCVALSTTEAGIIAANEAAKDVIWLKRLFGDLTELEDWSVITSMQWDLERIPEFHKRSKHIDTRYLCFRERVINVTWLWSTLQVTVRSLMCWRSRFLDQGFRSWQNWWELWKLRVRASVEDS